MPMAAPFAEAASATLSFLSSLAGRRQLCGCYKMSTPPPGVIDVYCAAGLLLAGLHPSFTDPALFCEASRTWVSVKRALLTDLDQFLTALGSVKGCIDRGALPAHTLAALRPLLALPHFNPEQMSRRSVVSAELCAFILSTVQYYDAVAL